MNIAIDIAIAGLIFGAAALVLAVPVWFILALCRVAKRIPRKPDPTGLGSDYERLIRSRK